MKHMRQQKRRKKSENFSVREKRIAKFGLRVAPFVVLFGGLSFVYPLLAPLFVCSAALLLIIAGVFLVASATRDAQRGVKRIIEASRNCSRRLSAVFAQPRNILPEVFSRRRHTCRARTSARSYRRAARSVFACVSGGDDSGGGYDSDSGDSAPPRFPCPVTSFQNFYRESYSLFLSPWRALCVFGCRRMPCCQCLRKVATP